MPLKTFFLNIDADAMIIDATNAILGRLSSHTAKQLLAGNEVSIVNAEKARISGNGNTIKEKYHERRARGSPQHGPFFPTKPELIVRRTIRGMLPYKTPKGRAAFKKLRVYSGIPKELEGKEMSSAAVRELSTESITVGRLAKTIGWRG